MKFLDFLIKSVYLLVAALLGSLAAFTLFNLIHFSHPAEDRVGYLYAAGFLGVAVLLAIAPHRVVWERTSRTRNLMYAGAVCFMACVGHWAYAQIANGTILVFLMQIAEGVMFTATALLAVAPLGWQTKLQPEQTH